MDHSVVATLKGSTVKAVDGTEIGKVADVYVDDDTGRPQWVTVRTGKHGKKESFVPVRSARLEGDVLHVDETAERVEEAPQIDPDGTLSERHEQEIYRYYDVKRGAEAEGLSLNAGGVAGAGAGAAGVGAAAGGSGPTRTAEVDQPAAGAAEAAAARHAGAGQDGRQAGSDDAMTRSEERLTAGTEEREAGRVRLRKYVETETEQVEVPVTRERVRLEREPITEDNRDQALSGPELTEQEHEVTLREERPVVEKETVPTERVRLGKETVSDTETVSEDVRKERIDIEGETGPR